VTILSADHQVIRLLRFGRILK